MSECIAEVKNIGFNYGNYHVFDNVSLQIERGDFMGIIGPNGSGKSTLLKIFTGLVPPLSGEVRMFDTNIKRFRQWGKIGYLPQKATAFNQGFPATVEEVVRANLYPRIGLMGRITREHREKVDEALTTVGMQDFKKRLIGKLSGGQQQRVFIAKALVSEPEILFMDEPTVGIDRRSEEDFYELMELLNRQKGITLAMVTHDIGSINKRVNRIACVSEGRVYDHRGTGEIDREILEDVYGQGFITPIVHNH